ncbi:MAG: hypothetical protein AABW81_01625, partial [Nanoarchaeota archaeon]
KNKKKRKTVKKSPGKNSINRKDFETFKFGVERLKELKQELDSLDTRGFSLEEQAIRSKLKNVSEILNVERLLKTLRLKINKKYRPSRKKSIIKEEIKDIKENIPELKREIKKLSEKIDESGKRKDRISRRDISEIKENLPELQREIKRLGKKVDDSPEIKEEIKKLEKKLVESRKKKGVIDSGVGVLVDSDFNSFLTHLKSSLSERIRSREKEVDDVLKTDLKERENKFRERYESLVREYNQHKTKVEKDFNKKYDLKVKSSLQKEISEKFSEKLKNTLEKERVELGKSYKNQLKSHALEQLKRDEKRLRERLNDEFSRRLKGEEIEEKKLQKDKQDFIIQKETEKKKIREMLTREFHDKINSELAKKERELRNQLKEEYDLELKKKIQEHEDDIKKKKLDLELEMQKRIKQVLR